MAYAGRHLKRKFYNGRMARKLANAAKLSRADQPASEGVRLPSDVDFDMFRHRAVRMISARVTEGFALVTKAETRILNTNSQALYDEGCSKTQFAV
jgi:hypothetical protein